MQEKFSSASGVSGVPKRAIKSGLATASVRIGRPNGTATISCASTSP